jgi:hypothetical protein
MKDHEIRALAARFGLTDLLHSKRQAEQFFAFVREVEKRAKEAAKPA